MGSRRRPASAIATIAFACAFAGAAAPVLAQQAVQRIPVRELLARIDRLESDVATLRLAPASGMSEDAAMRLDQVEKELRRLTGAIERLQFEAARRANAAEQRILDLETRLQVLEGQNTGRPPEIARVEPVPQPQQPQPLGPVEQQAGGDIPFAGQQVPQSAPLPPDGPRISLAPPQTAFPAPAQFDTSPDLSALPNAPLAEPQETMGTFATAPEVMSAPQPAPLQTQPQPQPDAAIAIGDADAEYRAALQMLNQGRFDEAGAAFETIAASYGTHPAVGQSKFWLGDMHLRLGRLELAAKSFLEAFRGWPEGPKAPESLLKLGITLAGLGQRNEACLTFTQFGSRYPSASPVLLRRAEIEAQRAQCES